MGWAEAIDIKYIMNIPLKEGDSFLKKEIYSYTFPMRPRIRTIIELEYYLNNIIVLSFYTDGSGNDKTRYRLKHNYSPIVVLRIYQACIKLFIDLNKDNSYTLVFNASEDLDGYKEFNKRMSSYIKFLEYYYPNFSTDCYYSGYMGLNTFYFHHRENIHAQQVEIFFNDFCEKVKNYLDSSEEESK